MLSCYHCHHWHCRHFRHVSTALLPLNHGQYHATVLLLPTDLLLTVKNNRESLVQDKLAHVYSLSGTKATAGLTLASHTDTVSSICKSIPRLCFDFSASCNVDSVACFCVVYSGDGKFLTTTDNGRHVFVWNRSDLSKVSRLCVLHLTFPSTVPSPARNQAMPRFVRAVVDVITRSICDISSRLIEFSIFFRTHTHTPMTHSGRCPHTVTQTRTVARAVTRTVTLTVSQ